MSCEESVICSSPDPIAQPTPPVLVPGSVLSSSRTSSISSLRVTGFVNGSTERLVDAHPSRTPSSQSSLPRSSSDVMPQADGSVDGSGKSTPDVDPQIVEALKSKDRLFVLKLGEQMETLIKEKSHSPKSKFTVSPENQYQRLLVHRCAQYYKLSPENDPIPRDKSGARDMIVSLTPDCKIPLRRIFELVPTEQSSQPTFKIMRRSEQDRRRQKTSISRPGSTAGEDGEYSDPGPSETGSMGSRSTTSKKHKTIAEREAEYEVARTRIFKEVEEKEKKERDTSASSSTLSLASASGSGSQSGGAGCSSISDADDSASAATTESEWSVPVADRRRARDSGYKESTHSFPALNAAGSSSERASGASSPTFTFPSLYEPPAREPGYDPQGFVHPQLGYGTPPYPMYFAPHPPPNGGVTPGPSPPYVAPYQYFPQFRYRGLPPHPPPSSHPSSSPASPVSGPVEGYPQHSASMPYMGPNTYPWVSPFHHHQHQQIPPSEKPNSSGRGHPMAQSPPVHTPPSVVYPYPTFVPPPGAVPYPGYPPYYQPQPPSQAHSSIVHPHSQPIHPVELPSTNGNGSGRGTPCGVSSGKGSPSPTLSRHTSSGGSSAGYTNHINGNKRGPPPARNAWSISSGPGIRASVSGPGLQAGPGVGEAVGPRLSSGMRRTSGASSNSSGYRTPGDETASVASSSTSSSSSRRTYMSTPPKHPLPPRPDWAAGLKAQPTLHPPTRNRHDSNNSRTMSPARPPGQPLHNTHQPAPQQRPPIHLQPADFPPLSSHPSGSSGKRPPASSAWSNNSSAARAVLSPNPAHSNQSHGTIYGTALFNHPSTNRLEDDERGFERPPPKGNAELFNPKAGIRRTSQSQSPSQQPPQASAQGGTAEQVECKTEELQEPHSAATTVTLIDKMGSLRIQGNDGGNEIENTPKADSVLSSLQLHLKPQCTSIVKNGATIDG